MKCHCNCNYRERLIVDVIRFSVVHINLDLCVLHKLHVKGFPEVVTTFKKILNDF